jgi:O-antigen/teichoic acid export membrane protein
MSSNPKFHQGWNHKVSEFGSQGMGSAVAERPAEWQARIPVSGREFIFRKLIPWATKGGLAIVDYGLISGSNFLLGVLLARWLPPDQYGAYALAFSIFVLVAFLYQALLLEPLSVFSGTTYRDNIRGYLLANVGIHWGISFAVCFLLGATAVAARIWWHSPVLAMAFAGMTIATPFILIHALGRRSFYLKLSPAPAAFGSIFYCVLVTAGVLLVYDRGWLTSFTAYLVMGLAAFVSGMIMLFQLNAKLEPATTHLRLAETSRKHWEYGKWALLTCVVGWIPNYVYIPLVSSFSGIAAGGELRALMNFAAPLLQTYAALSMLFLPYAARVQAEEGRRGASALTRKLALLFVGGGALYWAVLIPLRQPLFHLVYAGKYMESSYLVPFFALETMLWSAALGPAILLRAMESPRSLFFANGAASAIAIVLGIPATRHFGLQGVVWSMILANLIYMVVAYILLYRKMSTLSGGEVVFAGPLAVDEASY